MWCGVMYIQLGEGVALQVRLFVFAGKPAVLSCGVCFNLLFYIRFGCIPTRDVGIRLFYSSVANGVFNGRGEDTIVDLLSCPVLSSFFLYCSLSRTVNGMTAGKLSKCLPRCLPTLPGSIRRRSGGICCVRGS